MMGIDGMGEGRPSGGACVCDMVSPGIGMCVAMKRHGDDNEGKRPDKVPRFYQVGNSHNTSIT